jgi:dTDP-4-dehydrorhamnose reductase
MILVFGRDGQLGLELTDAAALRGTPLVAVPHHEADIADGAAVERTFERFRPSAVVNAAGYNDVERAEIEPEKAQRTNGDGPRILAASCHSRNIPLIQISTDYVFDGRKPEPYCETDEVRPLGAYARSKAAGEASVMAETGHYVIIRTSWLFGKYGRNFLKTMVALANDRDEITVVHDQHGCPTSARSLAAAILDITPSLAADPTLSGIYHFAGHPVTTWHAFATDIVSVQAAATGRHPQVIAVSSADYGARVPRPVNSALDCTKIKHIFGIRGTAWQTETIDIVNELLSAETMRAEHVT